MAEPTAEQQEIAKLKAEIEKRDKADAAREAKEVAEARAEAERVPDKTVPGGVYIVNGVKRNAHGDEIK